MQQSLYIRKKSLNHKIRYFVKIIKKNIIYEYSRINEICIESRCKLRTVIIFLVFHLYYLSFQLNLFKKKLTYYLCNYDNILIKKHISLFNRKIR